jgi:hypothetical protein
MKQPSTRTCPKCHATLLPHQDKCACGHQLISASASIDTDADPTLKGKADALYEEFLDLRLRRARRNLSTAMAEHSGGAGNPAANKKIDEAARELARVENEMTIYKVRQKKTGAGTTKKNKEPARPVNPVERYRAAQLAKAEEALRSAGTSPAPSPVTDKPPNTTLPLPPLPLATAEQAATASMSEPVAATQTCPKCKLKSPVTASHCGCGHAFRGSKKDEFISKDELRALRDTPLK